MPFHRPFALPFPFEIDCDLHPLVELLSRYEISTKNANSTYK